MQIIHRISFSSSPTTRAELAAIGIIVSASGFVSFDLAESHESWPKMRVWIASRGAVDIARTEFSEREIADASWLQMVPAWHHGYPQPKEEFGYLEASYDLSNYCRECGLGKTQNAPFRMQGEPKWARHGILQLNWIFDEYFVTPEIWSKFFEPRGVACRQVLSTKQVELKTVVQLVVDQQTDIVTQGLSNEKCPKCGRSKYLPITRGRFPVLASEPQRHMAKTRQDFGSGRRASKCVLISQDLAHALAIGNIRGASFIPVAQQSIAFLTKIV